MAVYVLGPLSVDGSGRLAPRERVVLATLTLRPNEPVSAERLADALWGESRPTSWAKVVQGCVVRLRKALGPDSIATTDHGYALTVPDSDIDAVRFERLLHRGEELLELGEPERAKFALTQALDLWHGAALIELEHWEPGATAGRRLEELRRDAEELRLEASLRAGAWRDVMPEAGALVAEEPLREPRWALLARAQYQSGRQADALATLQRARTVLVGELGLDPGPDLVALEQAILQQDPSLLPVPSQGASPVCPYRGLLPYGIDQAEDFFGRDADLEACQVILNRENVLAVVGPSGSGKSSLVRAGVAAAAQRDGGSIAIIKPGVHPVVTLTEAEVVGTSTVLVVDQAEEVVTVCSDGAERDAFLDAVIAHATFGAVVVLAIRADRLGELTGHRGFARLLERGLHLLAPMSEQGLRSAIEGPARRAGLLLEPGLVDVLVQEVSGEPGALPMLSHALVQTWENREGRTLTVAGYRKAGGIRGAVARTAENVYQGLDPEQQQGLRDLLLRMVASAPDVQAARGPLPRSAIASGSTGESLVDILVTARLLTSDSEVVELAHESLIGAWPRLRSWLDEDVDGQRILRHLTVAADSWDAMGRPPSELYRGTRLNRALEWGDQATVELTPMEQDFLAAGKVLADEEFASAEERLGEQRRANHRLRLALAGVAAMLVAALAAGAVALREGQRADAQALVAQVRELSAASRAAAESDPQLAILLALEAANLSVGGADSPEREAIEALHTAVTSSRIDLVVPGLGGSVAWSPDGEVFVTEGPENTGLVDIRDPETGESVLSFVGHEIDINDVAFGPDGHLATAGDDGALRIWDADDGELVAAVLGTGEVRGLSFSAGSGRLSAAWTEEGVVRVVDAASGGDVVQLEVPERPAWTSLSPDGRSVAVSSQGDTDARVLDVGTRSIEYLIRDGEVPVGTVNYSPDGAWLAAALDDATVRIRDARTGGTVHVLDQMATVARNLAWSPDSGRLAAAGVDGAVHVFDVTTSAVEPAFVLTGGATGPIDGLSFSPDGTRLLSGQENIAAVTVWDLGIGGDAEVANLPANQSAWSDVAFTPDGHVAITGGEGSVTVWDPSDQSEVQHLVPAESGGSPDAVREIAISADGTMLAAGGGVTGRLWDLGTGEELFAETPDEEGWLHRPSFSPDGQRLAWSGYGAVAIVGLDGAVSSLREAEPGSPLLSGARFAPGGRVVSVVEAHATPGRATDGRLLLWDWEADSVERWEVPVGDRHAYSPDGALLATKTFKATVEVYDVASKEHLASLGGHTANVTDMAFSPDGAVIAIAGADGAVALYDATTGETVLRLPMLAGDIGNIAFSRDGRQFATTSQPDNVVRIWALDPTDLVALARDRVYRPLTSAECEQYLHTPDCQ
ncbi:MAG: BTAD domain-containing putative transcriptional regulator [Actinomycetales bacterium]